MTKIDTRSKKITYAGLLVAIGIIYGDIGTSPLYVLKAIIGSSQVSEDLVLGSVSCVFWTLTLLTTIKYVWIILTADNNGEGGIFALFALIRKKSKLLIIPAMLGGATLLADSILTPSVTITTSIEGLNILKERKEKILIQTALETLSEGIDNMRYNKTPISVEEIDRAIEVVKAYAERKKNPSLEATQQEIADNFRRLTQSRNKTDRLFLLSSTKQSINQIHNFIDRDVVPVVPIVMGIIVLLFLIQQFGTHIIGRSFGPLMLLWFISIAAFGLIQLVQLPVVLKALNPYYAYKLLFHEPQGIMILGAVFLCTTGAEALYSDLGHCGKENIRATWGFVKIALLLSYTGQAAYILRTYRGEMLPLGANPFFEIVPEPLLQYGIIISTIAAIVASQALISGAYSLINEAVRLNLWPKLKIIYPSDQKGQLYIPSVNWSLMLGCIVVVAIFRTSTHMEAAYGLSITIAMITTTILMLVYLRSIKHVPLAVVALFGICYLTIESIFLKSNLGKIAHGGWFTLVLGFLIWFIMWIWNKGRRIGNKHVTFTPIKDYYDIIKAMNKDETIPQYASNLVYLTSADFSAEVESQVMYSLLEKSPKRADVYWLVHVNVTDEPYGRNYKVMQLIDGLLYRVDFILGFKEAQGIHFLFQKVVRELHENNEFNMISRHPSLKYYDIPGDFKFIMIEKTITDIYNLPFYQKFIMQYYSFLKKFAIPDFKNLGLDTTNLVLEKVPITVSTIHDIPLTRI